MEFFRRAEVNPKRLAVFPGTFNPPTRAHLALARAALAATDEVVFVLPRVFPHKGWEGATFEERVQMLEAALANEPRASIAASDRGLFIDIARECREAYGPEIELYFLCGADAAERIVNWDYGPTGGIAEQLGEYRLLVAPRKSAYVPPEGLRDAICSVDLDRPYDEVSATEVRARIREGESWEELVPGEIVEMVKKIYSHG